MALGDSLARILRDVARRVLDEFYVNDAGVQMRNIAQSIWYRALELLGTGGKLPDPIDDQPYAFYPGEYVIDLAQSVVDQYRNTLLAWDSPSHEPPVDAIDFLSGVAREQMKAQQDALMQRCGLTFGSWFSERSLHKKDASGHSKIDQIIERLKAQGMTYEQDGALWFATTRFGDDQDRVLIKSDGSFTYLAPDIAYHADKLQRRDGYYTHLINIWGADHHGYIPRVKAAMVALGAHPEQLEIILGQLVNLILDGEKTRMGKRKKMLTLSDLVDEVGVDAVRFWMVSKSADTALDFDVDLAASQSDENPVFYAQYAHARCASIMRNAFQKRFDSVDQKNSMLFYGG